MKRFIAMIGFMLGIGLLAATPARADELAEGIDYVTLAAPQPTSEPQKIEVVEMFSYACPHCYHFEPMLHEWTAAQPKDVVFVRIPAVFRPSWEPLARAYYVAEMLGVIDKVHMPLFKAIHEQKQSFDTEDALAKFFASHGVDEKQFRDTYKSFGVAAKLNRGKQMLQRYGVNGVPTLIINGKYRTSANESGSHEGMLSVTGKLVNQERAALNSAVVQ